MAAFTTPITLEEARRNGSLAAVDAALVETFQLGQTSRPGMGITMLDVFPWLDIPGKLEYEYQRELGLPTITPRGLNETVTRSVATTERMKEALKIYPAEFIMDEVLLRTDAGRLSFANQASMHAKAIMGTVLNHLIKGDEGSSPHQLTGFQARCSGDQLVSEGSTNGGDPLQVKTLRAAIDRCYGDNKVIICSKAMSRYFDAAVGLASVGAAIREGVSQFGMKCKTFDGIPIVPIADLDGSDNILQFNEVGAGGSTATATSVYIASLGLNGVHGLRNGAFFNQQLPSGAAGEQAQKGQMLYLPGVAVKRKAALVRIYGISDTAIVA